MRCRCPLSWFKPNHLMMVTAWEIRINWSWSEDDESSYGTFPFNDPLPWVRRLIEGLFYLTWVGLYLDSAAQIKYQSRHLATSSGFLIKQTRVIGITISIFHSWRLLYGFSLKCSQIYWIFKSNMKMFCNQYPRTKMMSSCEPRRVWCDGSISFGSEPGPGSRHYKLDNYCR